MAKKVTVLLAHPSMDKSVANKAIVEQLNTIDEVNVVDLYKSPYQPFDISYYANLLNESSALVLQFPLYWATAPSELKRWIDEVFTVVFEKVVMNKPLLVVTTAGSEYSAYRTGGRNRYTMDEFLRPFEAMTLFTGMVWQTPIVIYGLGTPDANKNLLQGIDEYRTWIQNHIQTTK